MPSDPVPASEAIARLLSLGLIDAATAQRLLGSRTIDPTRLLASLDLHASEAVQLQHRIHQQRLAAAAEWQLLGDPDQLPPPLADLPLPRRGWEVTRQPTATPPAELIADWAFTRTVVDLPGTRALLDAELGRALDRDAATLDQAALIGPCLARLRPTLPVELASALQEAFDTWVADLPEDHSDEGLSAAGDDAAWERLATWPRASAIPHLLAGPVPAAVQDRLTLILTLRFGRQADDWAGWRRWLTAHRPPSDPLQHLLTPRLHLLVWCWAARRGLAPDLLLALAAPLGDRHPVAAEDFAMRWSLQLPDAEWRHLLGRPPATAPTGDFPPEADGAPEAPEPVGTAEPPPLETVEVEATAEATPPAHGGRRPDWLQHLRSFIDEHWLLLAGAVLFLAGASLLAYYTWDKHWLVRYSLLPGLLAVLTIALARLGTWLERRDPGFAATATILRGLAVGLLPAHAMVPALLAGDEAVTGKTLILPLALLLYAGGIGLALRRWCRAVHPLFGGDLARALGAGVAIVLAAPLAGLLGCPRAWLPELIWLANVLALGLGAWAVHRHTRALAGDPSLGAERLAWFAGGTLAVTLAQALAWSHGQLGIVPDPAAYGPLLIAAGWLVLLVERRANQRQAQAGAALRSESFIGFAGIGLGLTLSIADPGWRILALACAAAAWFDQARGRQQARHWWLASILAAASGFAVTALPGLTSLLRAPLAVLVGCSLLLSAGLLRRSGPGEALRGVGIASLVASVALAVVLQWHSHSPPWLTGACLVVVAVILAWQACRADRQRWALLAACIAGLALPYLGCVDLVGRQWHGNHLVTGFTVLALLWTLAGRLPGAACLARSRSLVGFCLGLLAIVALLVRVALETGLPGETSAWHMALDYSGSLGMAGVLIAVAWWSRSLVPGLLAAVVLVILFPELKARFAATFDQLGWGTGLGGSITALVLVLAAWGLARARWLRDLAPGDALIGTRPFPWRRFDHSLLTWPILAAAVFLVLRLDSLTLGRQWLAHGPRLPWQTVIAVGLAVPTWVLLAWYRGPLPGHGGPLQVWWRRLGAWALAASLLIVMPVLLLRTVPGLGLAELAGWALLVLALVAAGLRTLRGWTARGLAARLDRAVTRLAVPAGLVLLLALLLGEPPRQLAVLALACAGLALVDAGRSGHRGRGSWAWTLVWSWFLVWVVRGTAPGFDPDWLRLARPSHWTPVLLAVLLAQLPLALREWRFRRHGPGHLGRGLGDPLVGSCQLLTGAGLLGLALALPMLQRLPPGELPGHATWALLVADLALLAWLQRHAFDALLAVIAIWLWHAQAGWAAGGEVTVLLRAQLGPGSLASLAALWALLPPTADRLLALAPALRPRHDPLWPGGDRLVLLIPALLLSGLGLLQCWAQPELRATPAALTAAYALLLAPLLACADRRCRTVAVVLCLLTLASADIWAVRVGLGDRLLALGLSELHLVAIGLAGTALLLAGLVKLLPPLRATVRLANLAIAGLLLILTAANYLAHPDLATLTWPRLLTSALIALVAGRAFRHLAIGALSDDPLWRRWGTAGYHLASSLAITCLALLIPPLRSPALALIALALPVGWFWWRAERRPGPGYRDSAALLGSLLVLVTLFRSAFLLLLFPEQADQVGRHDHYHDNAAMLMLLGLVLLRLTGLGADRLVALLGGIALMVGSWFLLTALPGLSPFTHPVAGAWCAVALAHLATLATDQRSPLRTGLMRLLACDATTWVGLRRQWGLASQVLTQAAVVSALMRAGPEQGGQLIPLGLAACSLLLHQGLVRGGRWHVWLAIWGSLAVLHLGLVTPAWAPRQTCWALPGIWAGLVLVVVLLRAAASGRFAWLLDRRILLHPATVAPLLVLIVAHVALADPASARGLGLAALTLVIAALTPCRPQRRWASWLLLGGLAHLGWFGTVAAGWPAASGLPAMVLALLAIAVGAAARGLHARPAEDPQDLLAARLLSALAAAPTVLPAVAFAVALGLAGTCLLLFAVLPGAAPGPGRAGAMIATGLLLAWCWYREAVHRQRAWCLVLAQVAVALVLVTVRQEVRHHLPGYRIEHDVWGGLLLSLLISGAKQLWQDRPRYLHLPLAWSAAILPLTTLSWILLHDLGTDLALLAIGLHSVGFSYLGGRDRQSPFHALAVSGFVGLALLIAWSKLELRVLHAYALPTGLGILVLLQLFRDRIPGPLRNGVRGVVLVAMLGSTAFHALLDGDHPLLFHVCLLLTALAVLVAGGLLRLRVYLVLGLAGVLLAVGSLTVLGLREVERGVRMSLIGGLVLVTGAGLIGITILLKARRDEMLACLDTWRKRWQGWE